MWFALVMDSAEGLNLLLYYYLENRRYQFYSVIGRGAAVFYNITGTNYSSFTLSLSMGVKYFVSK
jgi:hypothetical protein